MNSPPSVPARAASASAVAAIALLAAASVPAAEPTEVPSTVAVRVADLNLESDAGIRVMLQRLSAAAHAVCGRADVRDLAEYSLSEACYQRALASAVSAAHSERLSALVAHHRTRAS